MYAIIRIRGEVNVNKKLEHTLELLRLFRVNHLSLAEENESNRKMIKKVENYVAFGEIDEAHLAILLKKRGRLPGNKRLDEEFLKKNGFSDFNELARAILADRKKIFELGIKPVFRLNPPSKGFERAGIKKSYSVGGALGYRAGDINLLVKKMA
jgi:large subunit ribosomal protein L30